MLITVGELERSWGVKPRGILHVGAHDGEEYETYKRHGWLPTTWVEMMPGKAAGLATRLSEDPSQTVINAACWSEDGVAINISEGSNSEANSLLEPESILQAHSDITFTRGPRVLTQRLDGVLPGELEADFLNMDIQGAELQALRGLGDRLNQFRWVYLEVNEKSLYNGCALLPELDQYLSGFGFQRCAKRMAYNCGWGDALYVRTTGFRFGERIAFRVRQYLWNASEAAYFAAAFSLPAPVKGSLRRFAARNRANG